MYIIVKLLKAKDKEQILKAGKQHITQSRKLSDQQPNFNRDHGGQKKNCLNLYSAEKKFNLEIYIQRMYH